MQYRFLVILGVFLLSACGKSPTAVEQVRPICNWRTDTLYATNGAMTVVSYKGCK